MSRQEVKAIATNFCVHPARRKKIDLDQNHESIAKQITAKYGGDMLLWEYCPDTNSLVVMFTDRRKFRVYFKEKSNG